MSNPGLPRDLVHPSACAALSPAEISAFAGRYNVDVSGLSPSAACEKLQQWLIFPHSEKQLLATIGDVRKARRRAGGSNVLRARRSSGAAQGPFCGVVGGAPPGSYPVTSMSQGNFAKYLSYHAPDPEGIRQCVDYVLYKH